MQSGSKWHMAEAEHDIWYWKNLARYYYLIALGYAAGKNIEDDITDDMEEAYAEFCRRDDLFDEGEVGHFQSIKED